MLVLYTRTFFPVEFDMREINTYLPTPKDYISLLCPESLDCKDELSVS